MRDSNHFDVIIIGGGHAGTEAALASSRIGAATLLLTQSIETLGQMSCNPAIGGIGKGHLVREIDALGGSMGVAADECCIHSRTLNERKGPAVRATRAQIDRERYRNTVRRIIEQTEGLRLLQQSVTDLLIKNDRIIGVRTQLGIPFYATTVVLTAGTFLDGRIHVGKYNYAGGRAGDPASIALAQKLREYGFKIGRLKTGTPPRIDKRSVDFSVMDVQHGNQPSLAFSFLPSRTQPPPQLPCHITHTNQRTHAIIRDALHQSPMYSGSIESQGPRYCPSIEDKIVRFANRTAHQIFVEPEGHNSGELYPNGISTALPYAVQYALVRSIRGFEKAHITRPGYAIEYDFFDPRGLKPSMESDHLSGLYLAGQINGTTGYEEAAAQGLIAGINAARAVNQQAPLQLRRDQAYIGVLIDDLVSRGTSEPYRMFTSRAEYRLLLRQDNADQRLTPIGYQVGLVDADRWQQFDAKMALLKAEKERLAAILLRPQTPLAAELEHIIGISLGSYRCALDLLARPEVSYQQLMQLSGIGPGVDDPTVAEQLQINSRYQGYIARQQQEIDRARAHEETLIPRNLDYATVRGLSNEVREKLSAFRPLSIGQAQRIAGMTPVAISLLLVYLRKTAPEWHATT